MTIPEIADLILVLADNKHQLGLRYAEWATGAPSLEAATAAAAMAQAELGHARALLPLLREFPVVSSVMADEDRPAERFASLLDTPFATWAEFVAANALFDAALTTVAAALVESSYAPLRGRARKIIEEERYHAAHGNGWLRRLGQADGAAREAIAEAVAQIWLETLCFFGPDADPLVGALYRADVIAVPSAGLRERFLAQMREQLGRAGLPPTAADDLPWARWDAVRRRLDRRGGEKPQSLPRACPREHGGHEE
jgi:phenylacetate-CoA oxygenase PaaI subunit